MTDAEKVREALIRDFVGMAAVKLYGESDDAQAIVLGALDSLVAELASLKDALGEAETLAEWFHEEYERLAPGFHYDTRTDSAVPWAEVPNTNRMLMIATAGAVRDRILGGGDASAAVGAK